MPRHNESPGRKRFPRQGGAKSTSGRGRSDGSFSKKSDRGERKSSSGTSAFGTKKRFSSTPERHERGPKAEGKAPKRSASRSAGGQSSKSFSERNFSKEKRSGAGQEFRKSHKASATDSKGGGFSKRSRFAKSAGNDFSSQGHAAKGDPSKTSAGKFPVREKSATSKGPHSQRVRSTSFGKPYKKTYRVKPDGERTGLRKSRAEATDQASPQSSKIRLNKFIANSGISSRREADELIKMGLISVNGKVISELGYKVDPGDEVRYENKVLRAERPVYILMNKPKGFLTTTDDPQDRKTVMHIIGSAVKERIYPVGRLDRNTTGLLLLTNDGDLADKLMHPSFNAKKIYKVELDRPLSKSDFQAILDGVRLEEGRAVVDDLAIVSDDGRTVGIELHIGWNRVVRRIFENLGYEVVKLDRSVYAGLDKKELARGQWRFLTKEEIIHLKHFK